MAGSLNTYARDMDRALSQKRPYTAHNRDMAHAEIVVCISLAHAENEVRILSEKLDPALYDGLWFNMEMKAFLDRGGRVKVLVEQELPEDHPVRAEAAAAPSLEIRRVDPEAVAQYPFNFMLVDDRGYRFETTRDVPEAVVVFRGEKDQVDGVFNALGTVFDTLWGRYSSKIA